MPESRQTPSFAQKKEATWPTELGGHMAIPLMPLFENHICLLPLLQNIAACLAVNWWLGHTQWMTPQSLAGHTRGRHMSSLWIHVHRGLLLILRVSFRNEKLLLWRWHANKKQPGMYGRPRTVGPECLRNFQSSLGWRRSGQLKPCSAWLPPTSPLPNPDGSKPEMPQHSFKAAHLEF